MQVVDAAIRQIDECRKAKDYYFADLGKMCLNNYGIAVSHGKDGSSWVHDWDAAAKQMATCAANMLAEKMKMIERGEWPSGT